MDDGSGGEAAVCEGVDVGHDIVPELALLLRRHGEVDVLFVALHLQNLGVRDGQTQSLRRTTRKTAKRRRQRHNEKREQSPLSKLHFRLLEKSLLNT